jgi:predicted nicotinamide N-methyase
MNTLYYDPLPYETLGVQIYIPDPVQVRNAYENGTLKDFPYWSRIWPSSLVLAQWLNENTHYLTGKKIFEVGAGLGLPSFVAAKFATSVVISDHIPLALEWINFNISRIKETEVSSMLFDWRTTPLPQADTVLMSDIGYHEKDFLHVHRMIRQCLHYGSEVVLTIPARRISAKFMEPLEEFVTSRQMYNAMDTEVLLLTLALIDFLS